MWAVFSGWGIIKMVNIKPWHEKRNVPINTDTEVDKNWLCAIYSKHTLVTVFACESLRT